MWCFHFIRIMTAVWESVTQNLEYLPGQTGLKGHCLAMVSELEMWTLSLWPWICFLMVWIRNWILVICLELQKLMSAVLGCRYHRDSLMPENLSLLRFQVLIRMRLPREWPAEKNICRNPGLYHICQLILRMWDVLMIRMWFVSTVSLAKAE